MGQAGRERVLARFTWEKVIGDARAVFEEAVTHSPVTGTSPLIPLRIRSGN
jgi:hypothetical protein